MGKKGFVACFMYGTLIKISERSGLVLYCRHANIAITDPTTIPYWTFAFFKMI